MSVSLKERIDALLKDLGEIEDQDARFEILIEYAERFREVPDTIACRPFKNENKVSACESDAYAFASVEADGTVRVHFAVENPQGISAKAMAVILSDLINGCHPDELGILDEHIVHKIFGKTISMGKGQGLTGMVRLAKQLCGRKKNEDLA